MNKVSHGAFLWRGFHHEWLRTFSGFSLPHRISLFESFISEENFEEGENWQGSAQFTMAQDTGVDGNYMIPVGYFQTIYSPDLYMKHGEVSLGWIDDSEGDDDFPQAISSETREIEINLAELGASEADQYVMVLNGISLKTSCKDDEQPNDKECNSDGMWPSLFQITLSQCSRSGDLLKCTLNVNITRAWTPNKGGLPPFEVKPFNDRLNFQLTVRYVLIAGKTGTLSVTQKQNFEVETEGEGRDHDPIVSDISLQGTDGRIYTKAITVLTGFSFELYPITEREKDRRLGRYIGALGFSVCDKSYDAQAGILQAQTSQQLWVPVTTINTGVTYRTSLALVQLGDNVDVTDASLINGGICINTSEEAPLFSGWWKKCGKGEIPPSRCRDFISITAP